jgi:PAS domain S-box-containing protein
MPAGTERDRTPGAGADAEPTVVLSRASQTGWDADPTGHRFPIFAAAAVVSVLAGLVPFRPSRAAEMLAAGILFILVTLAALLVPWQRIASLPWTAVPMGYVCVIALLRDAQGGNDSGLVPLFLLPVVWLALYGRKSELVVGVASVLAALVVPMVAVGGHAYPSDQWRVVIVTGAVSLLVAFTFHAMVSRDRARMTDLAEQSELARRSALRALEAREQLDSLLRAATETAVIGADHDGMITFFSSGAQHMLGYPPDQVVGAVSIYDLMEPNEVERHRTEMDELMAAADVGRPAPPRGEEPIWTFVRSDGARRRISTSVTSRVSGDRTAGYVVVASDVTEHEEVAVERERLLAVQREVTEVLVEQNHRLRELTQMKDDLVATVSHELRTPLTSIRGYVELLLDGAGPLTDEQAHMLRTIDRNSMQLLRVADDLLDDPGGAQGLRVRFVATDLSQLAIEAVDSMMAAAAARSLRLGLDADSPVLVRGDPSRLHQLFANLLSNAIKFTPSGGRVHVRVGVWGQFGRLDVLDDGPGIPVEERAQLFERFYRIASSEQAGIPGTGLGLAIAKSVIEAHDGTIDIVDTPGWSTTVRALVPLATHLAAEKSPTPPSAEDHHAWVAN